MKAYEVTVRDCEEYGADIVFADTANEAKAKVINGNTKFNNSDCYEAEYIDLRVGRIPLLDNLENEKSCKLAEKLVLEDSWTWYFGENSMNEDDFNRKKFEKMWEEYYE